MDKQKQIEEMAGCKDCYDNLGHCPSQDDKEICPCYKNAVKNYKQGCRKIQDNEIVITKEEYESLKKGVKTVSYQAMITESDQQHWLNGYKVGYRDGVIAVGVQTKQALEKIKTELIGEEQK